MKTCRVCKQDRELEGFARDSSRPDGLANVCRTCDNQRSKRRYEAKVGRPTNGKQRAEWKRQRTCVYCSAQYMPHHVRQRFCSQRCEASRRQIWPDEATRKARRCAAERTAGGLSRYRRQQLLHGWQRAGRGCIFCDGACETVEHIIPVTRGGTNYEGNLAPACRACNASKGALLLMEWRVSSRLRRPSAAAGVGAKTSQRLGYRPAGFRFPAEPALSSGNPNAR